MAFGVPTASHNVLDCAISMEPRGEAAIGLISADGSKFFERLRIGTVSHEFRRFDNAKCRKEFPGLIALAHNRYATKGDSKSIKNVQPFLVEDSRYGPFAIAHNGTLVNMECIKREIKKNGAAIRSTSDTEIFIHLILKSKKKTLEKAILYALKKVKVAYSLIIVAKNKAFAIRDKYGIRPLSIAEFGEGYLVCSETIAFEQFLRAKFLRHVKEGEMIVFQKGKKPRSVQYAKPIPRSCIFEPIYFMNPRSMINGYYVEDIRMLLGKKMGEAIKNEEVIIGRRKKRVIKVGDADLVIPILDSGKFFAKGLAEGLGIEYKEAFARMRNPRDDNQERSFTAPTPKERKTAIQKKLHLRRDLIKGKVVIVADDSIVRANTSKIIISMLKKAGAIGVIFVSGFPPIVNPCINGMDFQTKKQLIAYLKTIAQIEETIKADKLFYLFVPILLRVIEETIKCGVCGSCYSGKYPVKPRKSIC